MPCEHSIAVSASARSPARRVKSWNARRSRSRSDDGTRTIADDGSGVASRIESRGASDWRYWRPIAIPASPATTRRRGRRGRCRASREAPTRRRDSSRNARPESWPASSGRSLRARPAEPRSGLSAEGPEPRRSGREPAGCHHETGSDRRAARTGPPPDCRSDALTTSPHPLRLFRRHVDVRSQQRVFLRLGRRVQPCESEVDQLHLILSRDDHVRGFDVAVDHPRGMGVGPPAPGRTQSERTTEHRAGPGSSPRGGSGPQDIPRRCNTTRRPR